MKISLKTMLWIMFWISIPIILFQRIFRVLDFSGLFYDVLTGLYFSLYWIFWLFYNEHLIKAHGPPLKDGECLGLAIGFIIQYFFVYGLGIAIFVYRKISNESKTNNSNS